MNTKSEQGANTVRQYDDQEAELATHYSGNNNRFYIKGHTMIRKAMVLNNDGRWIYSDCTTNAELNGDEFWKLDYYGSDQVIETWVGDQLTEQKESVCPGEPVFTQEMADARGGIPPVGAECLIEFNEDKWLPFTLFHEGKLNLYGEVKGQEMLISKEAKLSFKPIDNRTDEEKLRDVIAREIMSGKLMITGEKARLLAQELMGKFTITLNKE